ncbi:hypothetical protein TorRG33x02_109350 [Trema orientale]|uniref:Uncharacterized protein n=1 Tax=Trema orientale TaxID=63057 RepID=A0A2P5F6E8_TREOI|nr:hypothetical protein TorRG33x02_109350 [Trema orientale]
MGREFDPPNPKNRATWAAYSGCGFDPPCIGYLWTPHSPSLHKCKKIYPFLLLISKERDFYLFTLVIGYLAFSPSLPVTSSFSLSLPVISSVLFSLPVRSRSTTHIDYIKSVIA